jgi:hypothetical protein
VSQRAWRRFDTVKRMRESRPKLFRGRHFRDEVIVLCVRWYLRYPLSYRNLGEMMAERGLAVDYSQSSAGFSRTRRFSTSGFDPRCVVPVISENLILLKTWVRPLKHGSVTWRSDGG